VRQIPVEEEVELEELAAHGIPMEVMVALAL
jgi:hypothetical protein